LFEFSALKFKSGFEPYVHNEVIAPSYTYNMTTVIWLREDLRLKDNPALHHAASKGEICPVYVYPEGLGAASYWWLHHSLLRLSDDFAEFGVTLILKTGEVGSVLTEVCEQVSASELVWNRVYSPKGIEEGARVKSRFNNSTVKLQSFNAQLLIEPTQVLNKQGTPFKVFTPFWRHCLGILNPSPILDAPSIKPSKQIVDSECLQDWGLLPSKPDWSQGLNERWRPGEVGAKTRLETFLTGKIRRYKNGRDIPIEENTSMLSPHLAFGEISPKQIWFATKEAVATQEVDSDNGNKFLSEIGWREFSRYLLVHFPHVVDGPFNERFEKFPWKTDKRLLAAWQRGQTGYPIVDAGMRELWHTGYMHNRVRMVVASFLTKHCLSDWREGMAWFWDTLVDADIANNTASWQWAAGCGADAAPYFRIFNPILQGEKFDKEGEYVRYWVPELAEVPQKFIHKPWELSAAERAELTYPAPLVDLKESRVKALEAFASIKNAT